MKYFINGGGREFDQLIQLEEIGWFNDNNITTLLIIPLAIKEDYWQKRWIKPMQFFGSKKGPNISSITTYSSREEALNTVSEADAIYFTGGSQEALIRRLVEEMDLLNTIKESNHIIAVGGGSAGMMALGEKVIIGASEVKDIVSGLGLVNKTIFDSHFTKHTRLPRLQSALDSNSGYSGMGLDDNTGAILNNSFQIERVIGSGTVTKITSTGEIKIYDSYTANN